MSKIFLRSKGINSSSNWVKIRSSCTHTYTKQIKLKNSISVLGRVQNIVELEALERLYRSTGLIF